MSPPEAALKKLHLLPRMGLWICLTSLVLSLNLFVFSLPVFHFGIWPQSETAIIALHALSFTNLIGLSVIMWAKTKLMRILMHPLVMLPFLIGLISLIFTPFYDLPLRNLLGSVRLGEGVAWWFNWASLSASAMLLCRIKSLRSRLCAISLISFAVTYALSVGHQFWEWSYTPYYFPDFLAFQIVCLIPISAVLFKHRLSKPLSWLVLYCAVNILMWFTSNVSGLLFSTIGLGFLLFVWHIKSIAQQQRFQILKACTASVPILVIALLLFIAFIPIEKGYYDILDRSTIGAFETFTARAYLIEAVIAPLFNEPVKLLTGFGWGTFSELLTQNLPLKWLDFTKGAAYQWDGVTRDHFHSHNAFVEILYSAGILSFILFYAFWMQIIWGTARSYKFVSILLVGGIVTVLSFWFFMPLTLPFIALTTALIAKKSPRMFKSCPNCIVYAGMAITGITIATAGLINLKTALASHHYIPPSLQSSDLAQNGCDLDIDDAGASGTHLSKMMRDRVIYISNIHQDTELSTQDRESKIYEELERLNALFCQSYAHVEHYQTSARLLITRLLVRAELLIELEQYLDQSMISYYTKGWGSDLNLWLKKAPERSDQAIPFLSWHLMRENDDVIVDIALQILAHNPQDPVGLWFKGIALLNAPSQTTKGLMLMRQALQNDIERYMPIDESLKNQLNALDNP